MRAERESRSFIMKYEFQPKTKIEISELDQQIRRDPGLVLQWEREYEQRVDRVASLILAGHGRFVMVSGPSASGKTTSALKLAMAMRRQGTPTEVISLDDFFRNIEDYPKDENGEPDLEHFGALDKECVNETLEVLLKTGQCMLPQFDFEKQHRKSEKRPLVLPKNGRLIIEGIHALNPELAQSIPQEAVYRLYVGLRTEYYQNGTRVLNTRDLRITRRMVRDNLFRGRTAGATLELWRSIAKGEERWIKPFKPIVDMLLDTSFPYEPCAMLPIMRQLRTQPESAGRADLLRLCGLFELFEPVEMRQIPKNSMLREFLGGLELEDLT